MHNQFIPAGTEIGANPYVIHRNKRVFGQDADRFRPERWLDLEQTAFMDKYLLTWGYGTRICLGKNIAMMETYKLLVQVSQSLAFSLSSAHFKMYSSFACTVRVSTMARGQFGGRRIWPCWCIMTFG